ncbi:MAG: Methionine aminopeptidase [Candidatus Roizmanbacteria bacterium GW2011_GWA2_37_7]|uniref:Methionine aminopeptidase n=1 Tax=Candidatus Roizmanbacteria bacterium GW2011_GWA2_37_7 TaxID=1618481 RepID=A0A0G0H851_9BACT|nr:MAG: Methionine aminopeptidase [Candidatus Roizmanbacteria bacterium GW2011_GWA2_37_7]
MIHLKTKQEIGRMKEGGAIVRDVVEKLLGTVEPGITTYQIDRLAEEMIRARGAAPSFQKVNGYRWTTCLPINEQAVHTPPSATKLKRGDVLTIDIGVYHQGLHTDFATTVVVGGEGSADKKTNAFLQKGKDTLEQAIAKVQPWKHLGEVSGFIEHEITASGYFILKELTGHGIGKELHEDPYVLNYLDKPVEKTYKIQPGLTIAIEIIYSMGTTHIAYEPNIEWSIITKDRSLSACFERSIAVGEEETFILT